MSQKNYLWHPTVNKDTVVFVSDDDLWTTRLVGGESKRLTSKEGIVLAPRISPNGKWVAYVGNESGNADVYLVSINGGESKRLTFLGVNPALSWKDDRTLIFFSSFEKPHRAYVSAYELDIETGVYEEMAVGPCSFISFQGKSKRRVLGRNNMDSARWKRYRGGTAGKIWVEGAKGDFYQILKNYENNLANPTWVNDRIYFISDHEGNGNIYSTNDKGTNLKRHTHFEDFYVRNFQTDGEHIVFHKGAELFSLNVATSKVEKIIVNVYSSLIQSRERFERASDYLDGLHLSEKGEELALVVRGKLFKMHAWLGAPIGFQGREEVRYAHIKWLKGDQYFVGARFGADGEEEVVVFDAKNSQEKTLTPKEGWGRVWGIFPSPVSENFVVTTNRNKVFLVSQKGTKVELIIATENSPIQSVSWSPDGNYLAYATSVGLNRVGIHLFDVKKKKTRVLLEPIAGDDHPVFDPTGRYLYFIGMRNLNPVYSESHFEMGFPLVTKPYVVVLNKKSPSPLELKFFKAEEKANDDKKTKKAKEPSVNVEIDFDQISDRVFELPNLGSGGHLSLFATKDKVFYVKQALNPDVSPWDEKRNIKTLYQYDLNTQKEEVFADKIRRYDLSNTTNQILITTADGRVRLCSLDAIPKNGNEVSRLDGYIDLGRINLKINPKTEWDQMYREAWLLQREHYWTADMSKINWQKVYKDYLSVLEKVQTRFEFSDLIWEMQGELGTSHCYEMSGDYYLKYPFNPLGRLGGKYKFHSKNKTFEITEVFQGDSWKSDGNSPLRAVGAYLEKGDSILAINGEEFLCASDLDRLLLNKAGQTVGLTVQRKGKKEKEFISIKCLQTNADVLYRQWVEKNKAYVHKKSNGKLGYLHIPNMMQQGYSEFYRHFIGECEKEGLVVDVRNNGGGHVSQLLLRMLSQKVIGADVTRWQGNFTYPTYGMRGTVVALTNEYAGSDGDIFSHSFKLMKIGKLVGKRTWGGVVGINGRYSLKDYTSVTQPEYSFWFEDVGYQVENYGTDPDIEVEITPKDWMKGLDPQLDRAIEVALGDLRKNPSKKYEISKKPNLSKPKLPK